MMSALTESSDAEVRRLRMILDAASDAYLCGDASGVVVHCNRAAQELLGFSREELIGAVLPEFLTPAELHADYHALYQQILADGGSREPMELIIVRPNGVEGRLERSTWVTKDDGEPHVHALYRDVTERVRLQQQLTEHARRLSEAQALARLGSWEWDLATGAVVWSDELHRIFGIDEGTPVTYTTFADRLHPDDREGVETEIDAAALNGSPLHYEARIVRTDGVVLWIAAHGDTTTDAHGVPVRLAGTVQDITDRKLTELELERLTVTDALTGLANRTLLDTRLEAALEDGQLSGEPLALLMVDLDGFKTVNDTHGHPVGDAVLVEISRRFAACIRPGDTLARVGGDEFAVLLPGADRSDASGIAQRLVDAAETPVVINDAATVTVGASVGIAVCETSCTGVGELRRQADRAMYTAKRSGRGCLVVFAPELVVTGTDRLTVRPRDARAWANYMVALRAEIAQCKDDGLLPETSRAPASVLRTLELLLATIQQLPQQREHAQLPLPERIQLEEFVFHQSMVNSWADTLADRGVLTVCQPPRATAFWTQLRDATTTAS